MSSSGRRETTVRRKQIGSDAADGSENATAIVGTPDAVGAIAT